jgi:hypothetical protein
MTRELALLLRGRSRFMTSLELFMPAPFPILQKLLTRCSATLQQAHLRPRARIDLAGDLLGLCGVTGARGQVADELDVFLSVAASVGDSILLGLSGAVGGQRVMSCGFPAPEREHFEVLKAELRRVVVWGGGSGQWAVLG